LDECKFLTHTGNLIATFGYKLFSAPKKVLVKDEDGYVRAVIMDNSVIQLSQNAKVFVFPPATGKFKGYKSSTPDIIIKEFKFYDRNDRLIAKAGVDLLAANSVTAENCYGLKIVAGVDAAFIVFLCSALDYFFMDPEKA